MTPSPFVRATLTATRTQVADGQAVVEGWLDRLDQLLSLPEAETTAEDLYDLLACWGALQRVRPDLLTQLDETDLSGQGERSLQQHLPGRAGEVLAIPQPQEWLETAQSWLTEARDHCDPAERVEHLVCLLTDLDEAELVAWGIRRWGIAPGKLTTELQRCATWLVEHPEVFVPTGVYVQAVGLGVDPGLPGRDLPLTWTADKFVVLLDELERIEAYLSFADIIPLSPEELAQARQSLEPRPHTTSPWLPPVRVRPLAAAQGVVQSPRPGLLRWRSPDQHLVALLVLPEWSDTAMEMVPIRLTIFEGEEPTSQLTGCPVWLAGVQGILNTGGVALYSLANLRQSQHPPRLEVGPSREVWLLETNVPE